MDWQTFFYGLALGILANLLTPAVRKALLSFGKAVLFRILRASRRGIVFGLAMAERVREQVDEMRKDPLEIARALGECTKALTATTAFMLVIALMFAFDLLPSFQSGLMGALGGMTTFMLRWARQALALRRTLGYVENYEKFAEENDAKQFKLRAALEQHDQTVGIG